MRILIDAVEQRSIPVPETGCWLWEDSVAMNRPYHLQYGQWQKRIKGKWEYYAHRISYIAHYGFIPEGGIVTHTCDVPSCVNPEHLRLGTTQTNVQEKIERKRDFPSRTLTEQDVLDIRASTESQTALARRYGVHQTTIHRIVMGKAWRHLL